MTLIGQAKIMASKWLLNNRYLVVLLICSIISLTWAAFGVNSQDEFSLHVELKLPAGAEYVEVFYDDGTGYAAGKSFLRSAGTDLASYEFSLKKSLGIRRLRLDPGNVPGPIEIGTIGFTSSDNVLLLSGKALSSKISLLNQLESVDVIDERVSLESLGVDPYFDLQIPEFISIDNNTEFITTFVLGLLMLLSISVVLYWMNARLRFFQRATSAFTLVSMFFEEKINQSNLINFGKLSIAYMFFLVCVGMLMIIFKINQSSFPMYDSYLASDVRSDVLAGHPLAIRSDEWVVQTPYILNQVIKGSQSENLNIGSGASPSLTAVPVSGAINFSQPKFWGFSFFDVDRGFSWLWAYKSVGMLFSAFVVLMLLTKSNAVISMIGSIIIYSANFSQWWFSSNYPEIVIAFFGIVTSVSYLLFSRKLFLIAFSTLTLVIFSINFALHLYPPFLIPLFYLGIFIIAGLLLSDFRYRDMYRWMSYRIFFAGGALVVLAGFFANWYIEGIETIKVVQETVYPGRRTSSGGGAFWRVFTGYFDLFSFDQRRFPSFLGNVSEAGAYLMLAPLTMIFFFFKSSRATLLNPLVLSLMAYIFLLVLWSSIGFPTVIARYTLWEMSSPHRAAIGLGIANIILFCVMFSGLEKVEYKSPISLIAGLGISAFFILVVVFYGFFLSDMDPNYYSVKRILISAVILFFLALSVLRLNIGLFVILMVLISVPGFRVNPIVMGLDGIYKKEVAIAARAANSTLPGRWMVFGNIVHPQYFKALGLDVFNGARFTPDFDEMKLLDPDHNYINVWNRYAHIHVEEVLALDAPIFTLKQPDLYTIQVDPCALEIQKLGIKYLVFTHNAEGVVAHCVKSTNVQPINGLYIYQIDTDQNAR